MSTNSSGVKNKLNIEPKTLPVSGALGDFAVDASGNPYYWTGSAWSLLAGGGGGGITASSSDTLTNKTINIDDNTIESTGKPAGYVLTADGSGLATWSTAPGGRVLNKSANYTFADTVDSIIATGTSAFTVNLPDATTWPGRIVHVFKRDGGSAITVTSAGGDTVGGAASFSLDSAGDSVTLMGDDGLLDWKIIAYNRAGGFTTPTSLASAISTHEADTTSVHGIADTSILVTTTGSQTLTNKAITSPSIGGSPFMQGATIQTSLFTVGTNGTAGFLVDRSDSTKRLAFDLSGITTSTTRTLTIPNSTTTLVGTDVTQTLTNKTLTAPAVTLLTGTLSSTVTTVVDTSDATKQLKFDASGIATGTTRTLTAPDASTTIVGTDATQTLTNKTLVDSTTTFQDDSDATKQMRFQLSSIGTGVTRTFTWPNVNDTVVTLGATQTLTSKTLTSPAINTPTIQSVTVQDASDNTKQFAFACAAITTGTTRTYNWPDANGIVVLTGNAQTLSNKALSDSTTTITDNADATKIAKFECSGIATGTTRTFTFPDADTTFVGTDATQTLTNKTLTDSTTLFQDEADTTKKMAFQLSGITTGTTRTITIPDLSSTMALTGGSQTFSSKSLVDASCFIVDDGDATKKIAFQASAITTGTTRTFTAPDYSGIMVVRERKVRQVTSSDTGMTIATTDDVLHCDTSGGSITINLPTLSSTYHGMEFVVKRIVGGNNLITLTRGSTNTIDGNTTLILRGYNDSVILRGDSTNGVWYVVAANRQGNYYTATSATLPGASASAIWHQLSGNSISVPPGDWILNGKVYFSYSGSTAAYSYAEAAFSTGNGANSATVPAALTTVAGVPTSNIFDPPPGAQFIITPQAVRVILTTTTSLYINAYTSHVTNGNVRITGYIWAERANWYQ